MDFYYRIFTLFKPHKYFICVYNEIYKLLGAEPPLLSMVALFNIEEEVSVCTSQKKLLWVHQRAIVIAEWKVGHIEKTKK